MTNAVNVQTIGTRAKREACAITLAVFGRAFELVSERVPAFGREISTWEEGRRVAIGVLPEGPFMTIEKRGERIVYLGPGAQSPSVSILFKNLDSALLIFTGQLGAPYAMAENRVIVHGENAKAMQITRAMALVQTYLFPGLILKRTFKRAPKLGASELATKAAIYALLTPRLLFGARHP